MNTYNLPAPALHALASLTLHECTPGHSFQAALALEGPQRPPFRNATSFSGYGEGWGLYTEWLGTIMGIYETPYEDFGRLTYEMWRACRLVIDTGIHQFGWTRDQALSYRAINAPSTRSRPRSTATSPGPTGARLQAGRELQTAGIARKRRRETGCEVRSAPLPRRHPGGSAWHIATAASNGSARRTFSRRSRFHRPGTRRSHR